MNRLQVLNASSLKWIAVITMLIDHTGMLFFPEYEILRWIGRISFPLFAFLISEGYKHTRNIWKYFLRLGIFALISEIPYDYCLYDTIFYPYDQNIFFELLLGLLTIYLIDKEYVIKKQDITIYCRLAIVIATSIIAYYARFNYSFKGILLIVMMFYIRDYFKFFAPAVFVLYLLCYGLANAIFVMIAVLLVYCYNGEQGVSGKKLKWLFYIIYPTQFVVFILLKLYVV